MLSLRLHSHLLTPHPYTNISDVVRHYGCMQSQDIPQAMRVIGSRLQDATLHDVKKACTTGEIVRTWPMRGTLHYMAPEYVHRILDLCASRTLPGFAKRRAFLGISEKHAETSLEIMESALRGGKQLTRTQLGETLVAGGIPMQTQRVYHLSCYAATRKLICFGPPSEKEESFVLLDERVPKHPTLTYDEQLAQLATMYIRSHGPATVDDLARRCGLGKGECKKAIALVADMCETLEKEGKTYRYMPITSKESITTKVHLLGGFDEYFLGYKDRSPVADMQHHGKLFTTNGIFFPLIAVDGKVVGVRKRTRKKTSKKTSLSVSLTALPGVKLPLDEIKREMQRYAGFRGEEVVLEEILIMS